MQADSDTLKNQADIAKRLKRLIEAHQSLGELESLDELLPRLLVLARDVTDAEASSILLYNRDRNVLEFKAVDDEVLGEKAFDMLKNAVELQMGQGVGGWVAEHRESVIITDSQNDPRFSSTADRKTGFITRILARYWPEDGKIHFSRAGHLPPLLMSGNKILDVPDMKGISLGVLADAVFEKKELLLSPGHSFFFITDGLTEAENENRELLGDRAVHDLLCHASGPPRGPDILKDLAAYRGSAPPSDDLTIVEIRRETD